jgi:ATP sulfurylase
MLRLNDPHGGALVDRLVSSADVEELKERAARLPQLTLDRREAVDLDLIATGAASPLSGFLGVRDYHSVLRQLRLANGTPWPVPFTLAVTIRQMASVLRHEAAALRDPVGRLRGIIEITDAFVRDLRDEALALYGTDDRAHRGVAHVLARPAGAVGGHVSVLPPPDASAPGLHGPRGIRCMARRHRWAAIIGIATLDGSGCVEGAGDSSHALLPMPRIALRGAPGRDAFLQALVLKNLGARQVFFEHDRADWLAVSPEVAPEDLGITPLWCVAPRLAAPGITPRSTSPFGSRVTTLLGSRAAASQEWVYGGVAP